MRGTLLWLSLLSCAEEESLTEGTPGCDPLIPEVCALPFPSTALMIPDETTGSGWRVALEAHSLPPDIDGRITDPWALNEQDGFSTWGPLVFWLPDLGTVPGHEALGSQTNVVVIDAETGASIPVWLERDASANDPDQQTVFVRFARPMRHGVRHVVAVGGLTDGAGAILPAMTIPNSRAEHYTDSILPVLETAGLDVSTLHLAWDFVTHTSALDQADTLREALPGLPAPTHRITDTTEEDCSSPGVTIGRTVEGVVIAPSFLDETGALLSRGEDGMPGLTGEVEVDFIARIPCSILANPQPSLTIQFGHGLLGSRDESTQDYLGTMLDAHNAVLIASDWRGMSIDDRSEITLMMAQDLGMFSRVPERTLQGFVELDAVMRHIQDGGFDDESALQADGVALLDADQTAFYGISQGGILGLAYLGFSERLDRGVASVPGGPFTTLMPRSVHFEAFRLILETRYPDARDVAVMNTVIQTLWEPAEGSGWVAEMDDDVLIQTALGDAQVSAVGAHNLARALGARSVAPQVRQIWDLEAVEGGFAGSAIAEWRYLDSGDDPSEGVPADTDGDTHNCVRREPAAQAQLIGFLQTGVVEQHCDGPCESRRKGLCDG